MPFWFKNIYFTLLSIVFLNLYGNSMQLNFKWPESHIQLTPCHSTYTITSGNYVLDYNSKVTGNYNDCTFLIESPPGTQMRLNATISILNENHNENCTNWLKFYDFHSNASLVPFGEYCELRNITNFLTFSNIVYVVINISPNDILQLNITI
ncbi:CUB domain [Cinara cedri]|uniref:CUB domain n=1 Tax=Cinara cedri TaxID=506608 RepID=A0A5E4MSY8_9HEMI|nr:CUB domain [Cinara cedri]